MVRLIFIPGRGTGGDGFRSIGGFSGRNNPYTQGDSTSYPTSLWINAKSLSLDDGSGTISCTELKNSCERLGEKLP